MKTKKQNKTKNLNQKNEFKTNLEAEKNEFINFDLAQHSLNKSNKSKFRPFSLISPKFGLINDPCGIYFSNNNKKLYIYFQHHPHKPEHGLKYYSLAITYDFSNYKYKWLVNCPDKKFDQDGCFTGSCYKYNNKLNLLYTGNVNVNDENVQTLITAEIDEDSNKIINKRLLLSNLNFQNVITNNFRDPYCFSYEAQQYFLIGVGAKDESAQIWLFSQNITEDNIKSRICLIKRFKINIANFITAECPNIVFDKNKVALVFGLIPNNKAAGQKKVSKSYYCIFEINEFFDINQKIHNINQIHLLDYGFDFYAPQFFSMNNQIHMIGWAGVPEISVGEEISDLWMGCLTPIKIVNLVNNRLVTKLISKYANEISLVDHPKLFLKEILIQKGKSYYGNIYDGQHLIMNIIYDGSSQIFELERFNHLSQYLDQYKIENRRRMRLSKPLEKINFLFDVSFFQLELNDGQYVLSGRIYPINGLRLINMNKIDKLETFTTKIFENL